MKAKLLGIVLCLMIAIPSLLAMPSSAYATPGGVGSTIAQTFPDTNLQSAVVSQLGVTDASHIITQADIDDSTSWDFGSKSISSIEGVQYFTNLTYLYLADNQISDLSPLSGLTNLQFLILQYNKVSDVSPLSGLTHLISLHLGWNQISDVSPLSGLTNLDALFLPYNQITDISLLSSLTSVHMLDLSFNDIADVSPLSELTDLQDLYLEGNQIVHVDPLSGLTNLQELYLDHNHIYDISPLVGLVNLANEWGLTLNDQTTILPIVTVVHGELTTANIVTFVDGSLVTPATISDTGTYANPQLNWIGLPENTTTVYTHTKDVTIGTAPATFSGTVWQPTQPAYLVTYDANGGIGPIPVDTSIYAAGSSAAVDFTTLPTKTGYLFTGWSDGTTIYSSDGTTSFTMPAADTVLTAVWVPQPTATSDDNPTTSYVVPKTGDDLGTIAGRSILAFLGVGLALVIGGIFIRRRINK